MAFLTYGYLILRQSESPVIRLSVFARCAFHWQVFMVGYFLILHQELSPCTKLAVLHLWSNYCLVYHSAPQASPYINLHFFWLVGYQPILTPALGFSIGCTLRMHSLETLQFKRLDMSSSSWYFFSRIYA